MTLLAGWIQLFRMLRLRRRAGRLRDGAACDLAEARALNARARARQDAADRCDARAAELGARRATGPPR